MISDPTVAGTTVEHLAHNCPNPIIIIKDPRPRQIKTESKYRFGVCYDDSAKSKEALRTVLGMMKADDNLVIITVKENDIKTETIESTVNSICAECNISTQTFKVLDRDSKYESSYGFAIYKTIQAYLIDESNNDNYVDFIACGNIGNNRSSKNNLGSTAGMCIRAKKMNVIFVPWIPNTIVVAQLSILIIEADCTTRKLSTRNNTLLYTYFILV